MIFSIIRKRSKPFILLFSCLFALPNSPSIMACSYGPEAEEVRYMIFNPDLLQNKSWWSFFYNAKFTYMDGKVSSDDEEKVLANEWIDQFKLKATKEDAEQFLFHTLSDSARDKNSFYNAINNSKELKQFFNLSAQVSTFSFQQDYWQSEKKETDEQIDSVALFHSLQQELSSQTNPFLTRKYAFQVLKLAYYTSNAALASDTYARYFKNQQQDILYWWATHFKSMLLDSKQVLDSANFLHARVFSNSASKMFASRLSYSKRNFDEVLALASNDKEKADVQVLAEIINPGRALKGIQTIYTLAPDHRHLPMLIAREINKMEDWLGSPRYADAPIATDQWGEASLKNFSSDKSYLDSVTNTLLSFSEVEKANPDFFNLSLAYLYLLDENPKAALDVLNKINADKRDIGYQKQVLEVILLSESGDISSDSTQQQIGIKLQQLIADRDNKFESQKMLYSLSSYLRYSFVQKGMIELAGLFDNLAINKFCLSCSGSTFEYESVRYFDEHASSSDMNKLIAIYDKPKHNALETILLTPYSNKNYLLDLLAVKYLREGDTKKAEETLRKIPDEFWLSHTNATRYLDRDPFADNDELLTGTSMNIYNKREILERLNRIESAKYDTDQIRAVAYYQLGNAWFNFTQHSWFMLSYGASSSRENTNQLAQKRAIGYYQKALPLTADRELKAKISYMIAVLSNKTNKRSSAKNYETYSDTEFYSRRNCLTTADLAGR